MRLVRHNGLVVNEEFLDVLKDAGLDGFSSLMGFSGGMLFKRKKTRSIVRFEAGRGERKRAFYLKRHYRSRGERMKRLIPGALVEDGLNEWEKMILLSELGFPTMVPVAYGEGNENGRPASLTLTEELYDTVRVEEFIPTLSFERSGMEGVMEKRRLIKRIARLARRFHDMGFNHQDFYLGHFFIRPATGELFMVDLQRVQRRNSPRRRWIIKDLAQLVFSAQGIENFTASDLVRFGHAYAGRSRFNDEDREMIKRILAKSRRIAEHTVKLLERRAREGR